MSISNVLIISEFKSICEEMISCFNQTDLRINLIPVQDWEALVSIGLQLTFHVVVIDCSSPHLLIKEVIEHCEKNNPNCLFYGLFDKLDEKAISEFIQNGATSFALKNNLSSLAFSIQTALREQAHRTPFTLRKKQEYFLSSFFEQASYPIWVKDNQGKYLIINAAGARFIAKPINEIIGKYDHEVFPRETAEKINTSDKYVIQTGRTQIIEESIVNGDNIRRVFQAVKSVLRDKTGEIQGLVGTVRDVTERKQAEGLVKETERRLNLLIQNVKEAAVYSLDPDSYA